MGREELLEALRTGFPIAVRAEQLDKKLDRAEHPTWLSIIIYGVIGAFFFPGSGPFGEAIIWCLILSALFHFLPVINIIASGFSYIIGKILFSGKQQRLREEIALTEKEFTETTQIPSRFCYTATISKFIEYIDSYQADTIKECVLLLKAEERQQEMTNEIRSLKDEVQSLRNDQYHYHN